MKEEQKKWLLDILNAIKSINGYVEGHTFSHYRQNQMMKRAVEREFEIIGEAVGRLLREYPEFPLTGARKIVNLRNHIIHSYDAVSDEIIWSIVNRQLPQLKNEVNDLLESEG